MKILTLSDTHSRHSQIPLEWFIPADMIIHAGDISTRGYKHEIDNFLAWFSSLPYKYKVFIAGNHDWFFQDYPSEVKLKLEQYPDIIYLQDSGVEIEGIKIWGSPVQPTFFNWAFNKDRGDAINKHWKLVPSDTKILVTHGPAYNNGDLVINSYRPQGERVGCKDLLNLIERIKPTVSISGHIHCGYGVTENEHTKFINAATLDEDYKVANKPILFDI